MRQHVVFGVVASAAFSAAIALSPHPAHAVLQVAATFNGTLFSCVDNTACDTNLSTGIIQIADQVIGGVEVNGSIQASQGTPANPSAQDILSTSSLSLINTLGTTISATVTLSDTSFRAPVASFVTSGAGTWETANGSTATLKWWADAGNAQGADTVNDTPGALIDSFSNTAVGSADSFNHNGSGVFVSASPFSLTEQVTVSLIPGANLLNRGQTVILTPTLGEPVPEPASMALLGAGLIALATLRTRARGR